MSQGSPDSNRHAISVALFGMLVLTLGMGIWRFLYTPMLPVLLSEGQFTFDQLSWIASANYAGYLAGSLLFSFGLFHLPSRLRPMLLTSALATAGLILAMASFTQPAMVMLIRFLAGVASAGMMIFGSMIVLHHTRHPFVIAALFSGVGAGILLGNEYVISGLHFALSSHTLWLGAAAASALFFVLLVILLPSRDHVLPAAARASAYVLVAVGAAVRAGRIWLHHCRHLPAANGEKRRLAAVDCPSLVAGRHINNSGVFRLAVGRPTLGSIAMPDGEFVDSKRLRAHDARQRLFAAAGDKQHGFWRNVYGNHFTGDAACATT